MTTPITVDDLLAYYWLENRPVAAARQILQEAPPEARAFMLRRGRETRSWMMRDPDLLERVYFAGKVGKGFDPIELDPIVAELAKKAGDEANRNIPPSGMGRCHQVWGEQQRILRERHNIKWFTPQEVNPWVVFD